MLLTKLKKLRDPFIVLHDGIYYAYGTGTEERVILIPLEESGDTLRRNK